MLLWLTYSALCIGAMLCAMAFLDSLAPRREMGRKAAGIFILLLLGGDLAVRFHDGRGWGALPMHFCDWAMIASSLSLLLKSRTAFALTYFWGFSGTLQAILTPHLEGIPVWRSTLYIAGHSVILAACIYAMLFFKRRPRLGSAVVAFGCAQIYFVAALAVNHLTGQNFGFLSAKPLGETLLHLLSDERGIYLLQFEGLAVIFFLVLYLPWLIWDLSGRGTNEEARDAV